MRRLPEAYHIDITILNKKSRVACFEVFSRLFSSLSPRFLSLALFYFIYFFGCLFPFSWILVRTSAIATIILFLYSFSLSCENWKFAPRSRRTNELKSFVFHVFNVQKFRKQAFVSTFRCTLTSIVFMCMRINVSRKKKNYEEQSLSIFNIYKKISCEENSFFFFFLRSLISSFLYLSDVLMCIHTCIYVYICIHIYMHVLCILKY